MKNANEAIRNWPKEPRESAERLMKTYGEPAEVSASLLMWRDTADGWKRTELTNIETPHNFPSEHKDFLEQFIDYKVPLEMVSTLAEFDGSIVVDRTRGEMSARCGGTSMNFVAINLAHDIISKRRTVKEAREEYARLYAAHKKGEKPPYTQGFQFKRRAGDTADPDVKTLTATGSR
jgi:hypothetical protein